MGNSIVLICVLDYSKKIKRRNNNKLHFVLLNLPANLSFK